MATVGAPRFSALFRSYKIVTDSWHISKTNGIISKSVTQDCFWTWTSIHVVIPGITRVVYFRTTSNLFEGTFKFFEIISCFGTFGVGKIASAANC